MEDPVVVLVELPVGGRGRMVLDSAAGSSAAAGSATVVVVAMEEKRVLQTMIQCIPTGSESGCSSWS